MPGFLHNGIEIISFNIEHGKFSFMDTISRYGLAVELHVLDDVNAPHIILLCAIHTCTRENNIIYLHRNNSNKCIKLECNIPEVDDFYLLIQKCINLYDPVGGKIYTAYLNNKIIESNFVQAVVMPGDAGEESKMQIGRHVYEANMDINIDDILQRRNERE
jgi:hypothetical protein